jgi:short subunit dehydrogenase-like uncharacterized protein
MQWMIYGANGYTGRLIAREAVERGMTPMLAGRRVHAVEPLAVGLDLPWRAFDLDDPPSVRRGLEGVGLVLNCAGPFSATCAAMLDGCLAARAHYLDITGEIEIFEHCHTLHADAKTADIVVMPGAGFDVVPTDCLAALLHQEMPEANALVLAFEASGGPSPGTARTAIEGLGKGGRVRKHGALKRVPLAWKVRQFERDGQTRSATTIPWGDVYTAYLSTGIPDIEVYLALPTAAIARLRRLRWLGPLLGLAPVQALLKRQSDKNVHGPSAAVRGQTDCLVWGEVRDGNGGVSARRLRTPNGYELTVRASLGIVQRLLDGHRPAGGFYTPSKLLGADFVLGLPGVRLE